LLLDLTAPGRDVVAVASRAPGPESERFRRLLVHFMLPDMKTEVPPYQELRHLHRAYGGQTYLLSHWQEERDGRRYLVVVWHDVPRIVHEIFPALYADAQQSRINVVDADGRVVYGPPLVRGGTGCSPPVSPTSTSPPPPPPATACWPRECRPRAFS
jgi:two-component system phosphate regulon sensor histidine kinase PhoR